MNTQEHALKAVRTLPNLGEDLEKLDMTPGWMLEDWKSFKKKISDKLNLTHMALGLAGELGEIVNCTGTELKLKVDKPNLKEELGDIYWYLSNYCTMREVPIPDSQALKIQLPTERCFELLISSISELVDLVKRFEAYNKEIDRSKEIETVYDIYCALYMFETAYDLDGAEVRAINIRKLEIRYPEKFSDALAINRNTEAERKALES